jgi:hypothetical protein
LLLVVDATEHQRQQILMVLLKEILLDRVLGSGARLRTKKQLGFALDGRQPGLLAHLRGRR